MSDQIRIAPTLPASCSSYVARLIGGFRTHSDDAQQTLAETLIPELLHDLDASSVGSDDTLSMRAFLLFVQDLLRLNWHFQPTGSDGEIKAYPPDLSPEGPLTEDEIKERLKASQQAARNDQLADPSTARFVRKMEQPRPWKGPEGTTQRLSVRDLFLRPDVLADRLRAFAAASEPEKLGLLPTIIQPYLQVADQAVDVHSGRRLIDIWRYARYTWSMPFAEVPGRRTYYLVRDAAHPLHPIIGIGALGSCMPQLTPRDRLVGWSSLAFAKRRDVIEAIREERGDDAHHPSPDDIYERRREALAQHFGPEAGVLGYLLTRLEEGLDRIYVEDFVHEGPLRDEDLRHPTSETLETLSALEQSFKKASSNRSFEASGDLEADAQSALYKRKRATALKKLLRAKRSLQALREGDLSNEVIRRHLLTEKEPRRAARTALRDVKKQRIASSVMGITTCGALPPYNEVLGGKLVGLLMASPQIINDYREKYRDQVSVISSRMRGAAVQRPAELVMLDTTSLYAVGSSQYNRLKAPTARGTLAYEHIGQSLGHGSIHVSRRTHQAFKMLLEEHDDLVPPSNRFGSGTSYKMRVHAAALSHLGISDLQKHQNPRLIYVVPLAKNWREYLLGTASAPEYIYDNTEQPQPETKALVDYWKLRWFYKRAQREDVLQRLASSDGRICVSDHVPGDAEAEKSPAPLFE